MSKPTMEDRPKNAESETMATVIGKLNRIINHLKLISSVPKTVTREWVLSYANRIDTDNFLSSLSYLLIMLRELGIEVKEKP